MSALGQKQTYAPQYCHVRFTPNSGHRAVMAQTSYQDLSLYRVAESITRATSWELPDLRSSLNP
jgi:hypothetical protein